MVSALITIQPLPSTEGILKPLPTRTRRHRPISPTKQSDHEASSGVHFGPQVSGKADSNVPTLSNSANAAKGELDTSRVTQDSPQRGGDSRIESLLSPASQLVDARSVRLTAEERQLLVYVFERHSLPPSVKGLSAAQSEKAAQSLSATAEPKNAPYLAARTAASRSKVIGGTGPGVAISEPEVLLSLLRMCGMPTHVPSIASRAPGFIEGGEGRVAFIDLPTFLAIAEAIKNYVSDEKNARWTSGQASGKAAQALFAKDALSPVSPSRLARPTSSEDDDEDDPDAHEAGKTTGDDLVQRTRAVDRETLAQLHVVLTTLLTCYATTEDSTNDGEASESHDDLTPRFRDLAAAVNGREGNGVRNVALWDALMAVTIPTSCLSRFISNQFSTAATKTNVGDVDALDGITVEKASWDRIVSTHAAASLPLPPAWTATMGLTLSFEQRALMTSSVISMDSEEPNTSFSHAKISCVTLRSFARFLYPTFDGHDAGNDEGFGDEGTTSAHLPAALVHCDSECSDEEQSGVALAAANHSDANEVRHVSSAANAEWSRRIDQYFVSALRESPLPYDEPSAVPWHYVESSSDDEDVTTAALTESGGAAGEATAAQRSRRSSHRSMDGNNLLDAPDHGSAETPSGRVTRTHSAASAHLLPSQHGSMHRTPKGPSSSTVDIVGETPPPHSDKSFALGRSASMASSGTRGTRKAQLKSQLLSHKVAAVNVLAHRKKHDTGGASSKNSAARRSSMRGTAPRGTRMLSSNDYFPPAPDTVFEMPYHQYKMVPALRERPNDLPGFVRCPRADSAMLSSFAKLYRRRDEASVATRALSPLESYKHVKSRIPDLIVELTTSQRLGTSGSEGVSPTRKRGDMPQSGGAVAPLTASLLSSVPKDSDGPLSLSSGTRRSAASKSHSHTSPRPSIEQRPSSALGTSKGGNATSVSVTRLSDGRKHVPFSHEQFFARPLHPALPVAFGEKGPVKWKPTMKVTDLRAIIAKARSEIATTWDNM